MADGLGAGHEGSPKDAPGADGARGAAGSFGSFGRGPSGPFGGALPPQRMPFETVEDISSAAWITFEFISKARWAVIRLVISLTGSTFEPSR